MLYSGTKYSTFASIINRYLVTEISPPFDSTLTFKTRPLGAADNTDAVGAAAEGSAHSTSTSCGNKNAFRARQSARLR